MPPPSTGPPILPAPACRAQAGAPRRPISSREDRMGPATDRDAPQPPGPAGPGVETIDLALPLEVRCLPAFGRPLQAQAREVRLLTGRPWVRSLGKLTLEVGTQGWRFPTPPDCGMRNAECGS